MYNLYDVKIFAKYSSSLRATQTCRSHMLLLLFLFHLGHIERASDGMAFLERRYTEHGKPDKARKKRMMRDEASMTEKILHLFLYI